MGAENVDFWIIVAVDYFLQMEKSTRGASIRDRLDEELPRPRVSVIGDCFDRGSPRSGSLQLAIISIGDLPRLETFLCGGLSQFVIASIREHFNQGLPLLGLFLIGDCPGNFSFWGLP